MSHTENNDPELYPEIINSKMHTQKCLTQSLTNTINNSEEIIDNDFDGTITNDMRYKLFYGCHFKSPFFNELYGIRFCYWSGLYMLIISIKNSIIKYRCFDSYDTCIRCIKIFKNNKLLNDLITPLEINENSENNQNCDILNFEYNGYNIESIEEEEKLILTSIQNALWNIDKELCIKNGIYAEISLEDLQKYDNNYSINFYRNYIDYKKTSGFIEDLIKDNFTMFEYIISTLLVPCTTFICDICRNPRELNNNYFCKKCVEEYGEFNCFNLCITCMRNGGKNKHINYCNDNKDHSEYILFREFEHNKKRFAPFYDL